MVAEVVGGGAGEIKEAAISWKFAVSDFAPTGDVVSRSLAHSFLSYSSPPLWRPCWAMRWCRWPVGRLMCWLCPLSESYLPGAAEMVVSSLPVPASSSIS